MRQHNTPMAPEAIGLSASSVLLLAASVAVVVAVALLRSSVRVLEP